MENAITNNAERMNVVPALDVYENDEELLLIVDMPGVRDEAIELTLERTTLSLSADVTDSDRTFVRTLTLPDSVGGDVSAELTDDGVLRVHLKKRDEVKPRKIQINAH